MMMIWPSVCLAVCLSVCLSVCLTVTRCYLYRTGRRDFLHGGYAWRILNCVIRKFWYLQKWGYSQSVWSLISLNLAEVRPSQVDDNASAFVYNTSTVKRGSSMTDEHFVYITSRSTVATVSFAFKSW